MTTTNRANTNRANTKQYYHARIAELGMTEQQAQKAGIWHDPETGDILLYAHRFNGKTLNIQPRGEKTRPFTVRRVHPDRIEQQLCRFKDGLTDKAPVKYISEAGRAPVAYPTPTAIAAYQRKLEGGMGVWIEGFAKAVALSNWGVEAVGFGGLSLYKLDPETKDYLKIRRLDTIFVAYDGDCLDVRADKETGQLTSSRMNNFLRSALAFTKELFDFFASINHNAKIVWVAVNPANDAKGADDLLAASDRPDLVIKELLELKEGANWTFTKLSATNYERKLKERFSLSSAQRFYEANKSEIGANTFSFAGLEYRMSVGGLVMVSDPYDVSVDLIPLHVARYLSDEQDALDGLLARRPRLAIQADTGTGKTTFMVGWAKRTGTRLVIVVPTIAQCNQLARDHDILAVSGSTQPGRAEQCLAAEIIVATYDTLGHVPDLKTRALVVDEAHNMVNQYGQVRGEVKLFRAQALSKVLRLTSEAKQVVYLSGTMPKALLHVLDVPLVAVCRVDSPDVRLHLLTARNSKPKAIVETLASQLVGDLNGDPSKVHFVLLNDTKALNLLRAELANSGRLKANEIEVFSRANYNAGETSAMDDLVERSEIRAGIRLVLTTSIIAEGVNIRNTNVGNVYVAGVKCPDLIRQFVARFREMGEVDLFPIVAPEKAPGHDFRGASKKYIQYLTDVATMSARLVTDMIGEGMIDDNDRTNLFPHLCPDGQGNYTVDHLAILATDRDRMLAGAPTSYVIGRLLDYDGFTLVATEQAPIDEDIVTSLTDAIEKRKRTRDAHLASLRHELASAPAPAIAALRVRYKRAGDRNGVHNLNRLAWPLIDQVHDVDILAWMSDHHDALEFKEVRELIRRRAQLYFAGIEDGDAGLALSAHAWAKAWKQIKTHYRLIVLNSKPSSLPRGLRLDLLAMQAISCAVEHYLASSADRTITDKQLAELVRDAIGRGDKRTGLHRAPCLTQITVAKAVGLLEELFAVSSARHGTHKKLTIWQSTGTFEGGGDFVGTSETLVANPLRINDLLPPI
jgi:hypothetical protein